MNANKRTFLRAAIICGVIAVAAFIVLVHDAKSPVQLRLEAAVADGDETFDFAADPTFAWDRMFVFGGYSSRHDVENALGFTWAGYDRTSIARSETVVLVVFVGGNNVVHWYEQPRFIELGTLANAKGYARSEATFAVAHVDGRVGLKPVTAPGSSVTKSDGP